MRSHNHPTRPRPLTTAACVIAISLAWPAAAQEDGAPTAQLRGAELHVRILSPTRAEIAARFDATTGEEPVHLLLARFPGQTLAGGGLTVNASSVALPTEAAPTAVSRIPVRVREGVLTVRYTLEGTAESSFRFALPVPSAPPAQGARVVLTVSPPAGSHPTGDEFPRFERVEATDGTTGYTVDLPAVPAFVRFGYGDSPVGPFGLAARIEIFSLAVVLLPLGAWALWRRRSSRPA